MLLSNNYYYNWEKDDCDNRGFEAWSSGYGNGSIYPDGLNSVTSACDPTVSFQTYHVRVTVTINGVEYDSEPIRLPDNYSGILTQTKVTVRQQRNDQSIVGNVGKKIDNGIYNYPANSIFYLPSNIGQEIFRGSQELVSTPYEKYNHWQGNTDVINYRPFSISGSYLQLISQFNKVVDATVFSNLSEVSNSHVAAYFVDPWLINDYQDPLGAKNKGLSADTLLLPNAQNNVGVNSNYKGVFLDQGEQWQPPYYSVKVVFTQDIYLSQTGKTHKSYFLNWSANPSGSVEFQNSTGLEAPVVFKNANTIVQANLKSTQLSNNTNAYLSSSQVKLVRTPDGHLHMFY